MLTKRTSSKVAKAAGALMSRLHASIPNNSRVIVMSPKEFTALCIMTRGFIYHDIGTVEQVQAVAASALVQKEKD